MRSYCNLTNVNFINLQSIKSNNYIVDMILCLSYVVTNMITTIYLYRTHKIYRDVHKLIQIPC